MKYLKSFKKINEGYNYRMFQDETKKGMEVNYYFTDDFENQFKVNFEFKDDIKTKMVYQVYNESLKEWGYNIVKTNIYKIFETVFKDIFLYFISKNSWCEVIQIVGLCKLNEKDQISQRTKAYIRYLTNNPIEGWKLLNYNNLIYLKSLKFKS